MTQTILGDAQWYSEGSFLAYCSPWGAPEGAVYSDTIAFQKGALTSTAQITWNWPAALNTSANGMMHLAYGNYNGGAVLSPVPSRQVSAIKDLVASIGIDYAADPNCFNLLTEFYLTRKSGDASTKAIEIGFYAHTPATTATFCKGGKQLGTFIDRAKRAWSVSSNVGGDAGLFITLTPVDGKDAMWGTIDYKGAIDFLVGKGVVDKSWWFNGLGLGVEPLGSIGSVAVRRWDITYQ